MIALLSLIFARFPTYKYFVIPDGYTEVEIHEPIVQNAYEFAKEYLPKFLVEFQGPHAITLIHSWKKSENGDFYALELFRLRVRYLAIVHNTDDGKFWIHSIKILNEETESGSHWFHPPEDVLDLTLVAVKEQYGQDLKLRNVAVYKTVMMHKTVGQMVIDVETSNERMLLDITLTKLFGERQFKVTEIKRVY